MDVPHFSMYLEIEGRGESAVGHLGVMRSLLGWVSLGLCLHGLNAELIAHLHPPVQEFINSTCIFPFIYDDVIYYNCISTHSDYDWCSLDEKFQGRWRYCTGHDPPKCTFPFIYGKKRFKRCTKQGYILNRSWCSLTRNYNRDGKWKQCSPQKAIGGLGSACAHRKRRFHPQSQEATEMLPRDPQDEARGTHNSRTWNKRGPR
ncbi:binder of sperm protein homolog 2-like [Choloepus didactylus]|uniref:binder of sperm protein homolog 2-like n=1 Tax=Choloepus didactylus TaxID=27675 RepID=UPI0018A0B876|nr:binder of sperm protein homolog 2-like [Choloepus didactylus]